jgi:hypothetical protein
VSPLVAVLIVVVLCAAASAAALPFVMRGSGPGVGMPRRPLWQNPAAWVLGGLLVTALGIFLFPKLLGFVFLFLPFVWMRGGGRRPPQREQRPEDRDER